MNEDKPLLNEQGEKDAQRFLDNFKERMRKLVDEVMGEAYVECMPWIEADSWGNMRNHLLEWIRGYRELLDWDAKQVREAIYREYREDIIKDLNQDHLERIKELEEHLEFERNLHRRSY